MGLTSRMERGWRGLRGNHWKSVITDDVFNGELLEAIETLITVTGSHRY